MLHTKASIAVMLVLAAAAFLATSTATAQKEGMAWRICRGGDVALSWFSNATIARPAARSSTQTIVQRNLATKLILWIGKHTRYDISDVLSKPPTVSFCRIGEVIDYEHKELIVEQPVVAIYDARRRHIYLVKPWNPKNVWHVSTLLHEFIHFVQLLSKQWPCWGDAEREAYRLQELWLGQQGRKSKFNWAEIYMRTRCRRDIHP